MFCRGLIFLWCCYPLLTQALFDMNDDSGSVLCQMLTYLRVMKHKTCHVPTCHWDDWVDAKASTNKIVLSYSHNGFGNQLWQHSFGFAMASAVGARFLAGKIPKPLFVGGYMPPNTGAGFELVSHLLRKEFEYEHLDANSTEKLLCESEPYFFGDRPVDTRKGSTGKSSIAQLTALLNDPKPRCLRLVGYFQQDLFCDEDLKSLWGLKNLVNQVELINITNFGAQSGRRLHATDADAELVESVDITYGLSYRRLSHSNSSRVGSISGTGSDSQLGDGTGLPRSAAELGHSTHKLHHGHTGHGGGHAGHSNHSHTGHGHHIYSGPMLEDMTLNTTQHLSEAELLKLLKGHDVEMSFGKLISLQKFPGPNDICIYLRCLKSHYHFNSRQYYETILSRTSYDKIWVFEAPPCSIPKDSTASVMDYLYNTMHATK